MYQKIFAAVDAARETILATQADLHKIPELGFREWKTHAYLKNRFEELGYEVTELGDIPGFYTDESRKKEQFQNMVKGITLLCEDAANKGVTVSVEDYDRIDSPCCLPEGLGAFLDAIPELRFTVDTGNFYYSRSDLSEAYYRFKEKTVHAHLKDRSNVRLTEGDEPAPSLDGTPMYPAPVGGGVLPIKNIVQDLLKTGYDGYFTVEMFGSADYYDYLKKSADFLDNIK